MSAFLMKEFATAGVQCASCSKLPFVTYCIAIEEIGRVDQSMGITLSAGVGLGANPNPGEGFGKAFLGVASGNGKGQIFVKGEVVKTVPESIIVETLVEEVSIDGMCGVY